MDPKHSPLINLFPSYGSPKQLGFDDFPAYVRGFIETVKPDVLSFDHYPLREPQAGTTDWFGDLAVVRSESRKAGIPFWICLQSEGIRGGLRIPSRAEILWQASTVLAYGARGVVWFTYWTPSPGWAGKIDRPLGCTLVHFHNQHTTNAGTLHRLQIRRDPRSCDVSVQPEPIYPWTRRRWWLAKALLKTVGGLEHAG